MGILVLWVQAYRFVMFRDRTIPVPLGSERDAEVDVRHVIVGFKRSASRYSAIAPSQSPCC